MFRHQTVPLIILVIAFVGLLIARNTPFQTRTQAVSEPMPPFVYEYKAEKTTANEIGGVVESWSRSVPAEYGLVITDLSSGESVARNEDKSFISASIYKLFVAYEIYRQAENRPALLQAQITATDTVETCLKKMVIVSDEDCGTSLGWLAGWQKTNQSLLALGLKNTDIDNYRANGTFSGDKHTTAQDISLFLKLLYGGSLLDYPSQTDLLNLMGQQEINDRLPSELPAGVSFMHKTGNLYDNVHDAGFIRTADNKTYSFVVLTSGWKEPEIGQAPLYFQDLFEKLLTVM